MESPSTRRAWIEMKILLALILINLSPSTRRAWIEMEQEQAVTEEVETVALHPEGVDRNLRRGRKSPSSPVALHPEGVDRNTEFCIISVFAVVALHPEGVDRNRFRPFALFKTLFVALHPEGVDRNGMSSESRGATCAPSPSTRRAWIEIFTLLCGFSVGLVALHPEGVDRNKAYLHGFSFWRGRPPPGGRG